MYHIYLQNKNSNYNFQIYNTKGIIKAYLNILKHATSTKLFRNSKIPKQCPLLHSIIIKKTKILNSIKVWNNTTGIEYQNKSFRNLIALWK